MKRKTKKKAKKKAKSRQQAQPTIKQTTEQQRDEKVMRLAHRILTKTIEPANLKLEDVVDVLSILANCVINSFSVRRSSRCCGTSVHSSSRNVTRLSCF